MIDSIKKRPILCGFLIITVIAVLGVAIYVGRYYVNLNQLNNTMVEFISELSLGEEQFNLYQEVLAEGNIIFEIRTSIMDEANFPGQPASDAIYILVKDVQAANNYLSAHIDAVTGARI